MFKIRNTFATNEELYRQGAIQSVVLYGNKPTTFLEKKAAAIFGNTFNNVIIQAKVRKCLAYILNFLKDDEIEICADKKIRTQLREYLKTVQLVIGDPIYLTRKLPILALQPEIIPEYKLKMDVIVSSQVNRAEFEQMVFNNRTKYRYLIGTSFASYVYQNILYSLNARNTRQLEDNKHWQAKLALLIDRTGFNDNVAKSAFYSDTVKYHGVTYQSHFVPKYDVNSLMPQESIDEQMTDRKLIRYYYDLNVRTTSRVPLDKIGIFLTFPFKDGHHIQPDGKIIPITTSLDLKKSVRLMITDLCNISDIEFAIDTAARSIALDDVIYYALHAKNLTELSVALMIIRRLVGDVLTVQNIRIQMPTEFNILSWTTQMNCNMSNITLPPNYKSKDTPMYVAMIQDIAQSCYSKLGASMACSAYSLPEVHMGEVYDVLQNDAEKYIFYTLILQDYTYSMYYIARKRLKPTFGRSIVDMSKYPKFNGRFSNTTLSERLDSLTEPLVKPVDLNAGITLCPPYKCIEMYEFIDPQLNELVTMGDTELNENQLASYITLLIT